MYTITRIFVAIMIKVFLTFDYTTHISTEDRLDIILIYYHNVVMV